MHCTNCGAPVLPGQNCEACGAQQPPQAPPAGDDPSGIPSPYGATGYGQPPPDPPAGAPASLPPGQPSYGQAAPGQPGYGQAAPGYGQTPYPQTPYPQTGYQQGGYGPTGYGQGGYGQTGFGAPGYSQPYPSGGFSPYPAAPKNNGLAIASLVCSILGLCCGVGGVLGVIFGFVARGQIKRSGGAQKGSGLALAGIIVGFVVHCAIGLLVLLCSSFWAPPVQQQRPLRKPSRTGGHPAPGRACHQPIFWRYGAAPNRQRPVEARWSDDHDRGNSRS